MVVKKILMVSMVILLALLIHSSFSVVDSSADDPVEGWAGSNIRWTYDADTQTVTLTGTGSTYDFDLGGTYGLPMWRFQTIKHAVVNPGITGLGKNTFSQNRETESITLPEGLITIGASVFKGVGISGIIIPGTVTSIGDSAFENSSIKEIIIPDSVKTVGNSAFRGTLITSIDIPGGVTSIGDAVFLNTGLISVTIPGTVKSIGSSAFSTASLTSVVIEDGVERINSGAFAGTSIVEVTIPDSVRVLGTNVFSNCELLQTAVIGNGVGTLESYLFNRCTSLTSLTLGNGITGMDKQVFMGSGLTSVTLPSSFSYFITDWDYRETPFSSSSIVNIYVDEHNSIFESLDGVLFTKGLIELAVYPPGRTDEVYEIPRYVLSIGDFAFSENKLSELIISDTVLSIGKYAIYIDSIILPDSVKSLGENSINARHVVVGNGLPEITDTMFSRSLRTLHIGYGVVSISNELMSFPYLESIEVDSSSTHLASLGGIVYSKNMKDLVLIPATMSGEYHMPNSVEYIRSSVFRYASISSVVMSENLKGIGSGAFYGNKQITMIKIPKNVTTIGSEAFSGCLNLKMVFFEGDKAPSMGYHTFYLGDAEEWGELRVYSTLTPGFLDRYAGKFTVITYLDSEVRPESLIEEIAGNPIYLVVGMIIFSALLIIAERMISKRKN